MGPIGICGHAIGFCTADPAYQAEIRANKPQSVSDYAGVRGAGRTEIFAAIEGERLYQDSRWNPETTSSGGKHDLGAWILFMEDYLQEARSQISRGADPAASDLALHTLRKVVTMGVAAMEQHGVRFRKF